MRTAADARVPVPPLCRSRPGFPFPLAVAAAAVPPPLPAHCLPLARSKPTAAGGKQKATVP